MTRSSDRLQGNIAFLVALSSVFAFATFAASPVRAQAAGAGWTIQATPNRSSDFNQLVAITAISPLDAWAVGTFRGPSSTAFKTLTEHFDGASWLAVPSPNVGHSYNELNAVSAESSVDVWTAGFRVSGATSRTLIERWNGTQWSAVPSPNVGTGDNTLFGVAAISPTDAWAVGQTAGIANSTLTLHWDGTSWIVVPSPTPPKAGGFFTAVTAISSNDVWAVGRVGEDNATLAEHWDGNAWTIVSTPKILSEAFLSGVTAIGSSDVWAAGSQGSRTLIEHWDGAGWSGVASPSPLPTSNGNNFLTGVTALPSGTVWAVGGTLDFTLGGLERTLTMRWDGTQWIQVDSPDQGPHSDLLLGVDGPGRGVVIAVGTFRTGSTGAYRTLAMEYMKG